VTNEGSDVHFVIALSSQKLQSLISQFSGFLGGMAGAGAGSP
jgi:hypothetical protein